MRLYACLGVPILAGQIHSGDGVKIDSGDSTTVQKTEYTAIR